jgi:phosphomannomutase
MTPIAFGTDGWRAVIGDQFTFENVGLVTRATAQWLRTTRGDNPQVVLGHDTRFLSRRFAEHAARVFASEGVRVILASSFTPTPAISWASRAYVCDAGIVITASHNPPEYNGFKIKAHFGGPASPEMTAEVEAELSRLSPTAPVLSSLEALLDAGEVTRRDVTGDYVAMVREQIDIAGIIEAGLRVAHDPMFGAGQTVFKQLLGAERVFELHGEENPGFQGRPPEPVERNLEELSQAVVRENCHVGIANDGDADRISMYDERGAYVDSHRLLALLAKYLVEERGLRGDIVKTFSTSHMLDRIGEKHGLTVHTVPIGFKYIGPRIVDGDVLVGGEESGGMAVKGHIPERDGIYIGLLILEMMVRRGKALSVLVDELFDEYGPHVCRRIDLHTSIGRKEAVLDRLSEGGLEEIAGHRVERLDTLDGFKHIMKDRWLLVRPSGTEPVLRIYSEAPAAGEAEALIANAASQLGVVDGSH